jgi:hypothetical protein
VNVVLVARVLSSIEDISCIAAISNSSHPRPANSSENSSEISKRISERMESSVLPSSTVLLSAMANASARDSFPSKNMQANLQKYITACINRMLMSRRPNTKEK